MSFSFNNKPYTSFKYYFEDDNTFIGYLGYSSVKIFENGLTGYQLVICGDRSRGTKPNKLYFDMTTALDNGGAGIKIKLPLFKYENGYNYYHPEIIDAVIISDETNNFTQSGFIEWELPETFSNYGNYNGKSKWYSWHIIIETLGDTVSYGEGNIQLYDKAVYIENEGTSDNPLTFTAIHNYLQTIDTSLSTKNFTQIFFNCGIHIDWGYFSSKQEQITFGRNFDFYIKCNNIQYGEEINGVGVNGTSIRFICYNADFGGIIAYSNAKIYDLRYDIIKEEGSTLFHGHWGAGVGSYNNQTINGFNIARQRSVSISNISNVLINPVLVSTTFEPLGAIVDGGYAIGGTYVIRTSSSYAQQYVHNMDFTKTYNGVGIQNRSSGRNNNSFNYAVDCKWSNENVRVNFQIYKDPQYIDIQRTYMVYSLIIKIVNNKNIPISGANIILKDKEGIIVFNGTSNIDGYANEINGTITTVDNTFIEDSNASFIPYESYTYGKQGLMYQEMLITSGNNTGIRKIIKPYNTSTKCFIHTSFLLNNDIGDRYIKIPYIEAVNIRADMDSTSGYKPGIEDYRGPYTLTINKGDYRYSEILDIKEKTNKIIVLDKKVKQLNIDLENLN